MTNREYLRNILGQLAGEVAALRPTPEESVTLAGSDLMQLQIAINEAAAELDRLEVENIEEAYHIKPVYDRIKAVIAHERVLRNQLDRVGIFRPKQEMLETLGPGEVGFFTAAINALAFSVPPSPIMWPPFCMARSAAKYSVASANLSSPVFPGTACTKASTSAPLGPSPARAPMSQIGRAHV